MSATTALSSWIKLISVFDYTCWTCWSGSKGEPQGWLETWNIFPVRKGWGSCGCSAAEVKVPRPPCILSYLERVYKKNGDRLFSRGCSNGIRSNAFKLQEDSFTLNIRKKFFKIRVGRHWQWATQRCGACTTPGNIPGQVGWDSKQT